MVNEVDVGCNPSLIPGTRTLTSLDGPVAPFTPRFCGGWPPGPSGICGQPCFVLCFIQHVQCMLYFPRLYPLVVVREIAHRELSRRD